MDWIWAVVAFYVGLFIGLLIGGLCHIAKQADKLEFLGPR